MLIQKEEKNVQGMFKNYFILCWSFWYFNFVRFETEQKIVSVIFACIFVIANCCIWFLCETSWNWKEFFCKMKLQQDLFSLPSQARALHKQQISRLVTFITQRWLKSTCPDGWEFARRVQLGRDRYLDYTTVTNFRPTLLLIATEVCLVCFSFKLWLQNCCNRHYNGQEQLNRWEENDRMARFWSRKDNKQKWTFRLKRNKKVGLRMRL